jgi:hypothetical protein
MRLSIGLESWYDIIIDFDQAFDNIENEIIKEKEKYQDITKNDQNKSSSSQQENQYGSGTEKPKGFVQKLFSSNKSKNKS